MDIQGIKFFLSVAETRSFTESAELCNISQSSLSKSIMRLEQELDVKLFDRTQHPVSLTPAGECFYTHFKPMSSSMLMLWRTSGACGRAQCFEFCFARMHSTTGMPA